MIVAILLAGCTASPGEVDAALIGPAEVTPVAAVEQPSEATTVAPPPAAAASPPPLQVPDPVARGPLDHEVRPFDFGEEPFVDEASPMVYAIRLRGSIHFPTQAQGPFGVVVFQHGRHASCSAAAVGELPLLPGGARCPDSPVVNAVASYTGYDAIAAHLASHGYVVASVDANAVNDNDNGQCVRPEACVGAKDAGAAARAHIVLRVLDHLARLNETSDDEAWGDTLTGRLDLSRVGLMGHSRGGEGVTHAVHANAARPAAAQHAIRAVFAIAPIDRTSTTAPGVAWATILPSCDGDVSTLSGARIYDDSREIDDDSPKTQLLVIGANHNFYNTVWTADDAATYDEDQVCGGEGLPGKGRLPAEAQRLQGLAHVSSFFRWRLGDETGFAPLFDGRAPLPASACPDGAPCPGLVRVAYRPPAGARVPFPLAELKLDRFTNALTCSPPECEGSFAAGSAERVVLSWSGGATATLTLPASARDTKALDRFTFRVAADPAAEENKGLVRHEVTVAFVDGLGREVRVPVDDVHRALEIPRNTEEQARKIVLNDVSVPLPGASADFLLSDVREIRMIFGATPRGAIHLADLQLVDDERRAP